MSVTPITSATPMPGLSGVGLIGSLKGTASLSESPDLKGIGTIGSLTGTASLSESPGLKGIGVIGSLKGTTPLPGPSAPGGAPSGTGTGTGQQAQPYAATVEDSVYAIVSGSLTLSGGKKLPVFGFQLVLQHNDIPVLIVRVGPVFESGTADAGIAPVMNVTLERCVAVFTALKAMVENPAQRSVTFSFEAVSTGGDSQKLNLSDWLLTSVGFPHVSAAGQLEMALEIRHPAQAMNEAPVQLCGIRGTVVNAKEINLGANVIAGFNDSLSLLLRRMRSFAPTGPQDRAWEQSADAGFALSIKRFETATQAFSQCFAWNPLSFSGYLGYPKASAPDPLVPLFHTAISQQVMAVDSRTLWDWFGHGVCSDWSLSICPTFNKGSLTVEPFSPWAAPLVTINQMDITDFSNPPTQSLKVGGVLMDVRTPITAGNSAMSSVAFANWSDQCVAYLEPQLYGAVLFTSMPQWFQSMSLESTASNSQVTSFKGIDQGPSTVNGSTKAGAAATQSDWKQFMSDCGKWLVRACKQAFLEYYQRDLGVGLSCRLMIVNPGSSLPGNYVLPGCVFKIDTTATLLRFFCTSVVHSVDCMNRTAATAISGSYVRQDSITNVNAIKNGMAYNPLYAV